MNEQILSKRIGTLALITTLLLLSLFLSMERLTARASEQRVAQAAFTLTKTSSHDSAAKSITLTFSIDVHNEGDAAGNVEVMDWLPPEMEAPTNVSVDRIVSSEVVSDGLLFQVSNLAPGQSARLTYQTRIRPEADCGKELLNRAQQVVNSDPVGEPVDVYVRVICSDLGDAPASENHYSLDMFTLSGIVARYPTVYNPPSGAPSGPLHRRADLLHLGEMVSFERQADVGPDSDPTNNIIPPADTPDMDHFDDGLNRDALNFLHCERATLEFLVYIDPSLIPDLERAFINVWYDGNRDGDWADVNLCNPDDPNTLAVPEHIVIDHAVAPIPNFQTVTVNTSVPVFNPNQDEPGWLRVTLSEQPSVKIGHVGTLKFGDGRGVFATLINADTGESVAGFRLGETEDYLHPRPDQYPGGPPPNEPGLAITKMAEQNQAAFGDELFFMVEVSNTLSYPRMVTIFDPIPAGTTYVDGSVSPPDSYNAALDAIVWRGEIPAGKSVMVTFSVRVTRCEIFGFRVLNRARAFVRGAPSVWAEAEVSIADCVAPSRFIRLRKHAPLEAIPGSQIEITLAAQNYSAQVTAPLLVVDPLPPGLEIDPATLPQGVSFVKPNLIRWETTLEPNTVLSVTFNARVQYWACRWGDLFNRAYWWSNVGLHGHSNATWTRLICSDLGDAPDSTNHHGMNNTAYGMSGTTPLVNGKYPTVWQDPAGEPSGPLHMDATYAWLGEWVSFEKEADIGLDSDGLNNILTGGGDNANNDKWDDGWLNRNVPILDCRETTLAVRVTKGHSAISKMWLNVWFDGNRDGDWDDVKLCGNDQSVAFEWIVQNYLVDMSSWAVGESRDILVRTFLVLNDHPEAPAWMRFTLSERHPPRNLTTGLADGRGPQFEWRYRVGETEDYLAPGMQTGEPGEITIRKTASVSAAIVGDVYTYSVHLTHDSSATGPAHVVMTDVLPAEVVLAGGPKVTEINPSAMPLVAYFDSSVGPNGAVGWRGLLSPGAVIRVDFPVKVIYCPDDTVARVIYNKAEALREGLPPVSATNEVELDCAPPPPPNIALHKYILTDAGEQPREWATVPGRHVNYVLVLSATNTLSHTYPVFIEDPLQGGSIAVAAEASSGVTHIIDGGHGVIWEGLLGPDTGKVIIRIRIKLREVDCDDVIKNVAYWHTRFAKGESNLTRLRLACHDLGDAPDSSNHFNTTMMTYPSVVTATFPTVYTGTTPLLPHGPLHLIPQPLHLGPRVSFEIEADLGPDLDGVNNIEPRAGVPDLDKADDGLELHNLQFDHCKRSDIPVWISVAPSVLLTASGNERIAYINVWVDSFRDGDWDDVTECPPPAGSNEWIMAPEHIVIDHAVNLAALGPGLHQIFVTTTAPVPWPADMSGPAWLRVTLSGRPSNKTLPTGCGGAAPCKYGDGRGYAVPFALGETEDYLLRGAQEADPAIKKHAYIHPWFDLENGERVWFIGWPVHYANVGGATATGVEVVDTYSDNQDLRRVWSYPPITPTTSNTTLTFDVGDLHPGQTGHVFVYTSVPFSTTPGTVLTNTVHISSDNDSDLNNNSDVVTVTIPLLPPWITYPTPGTTCSGLFTITGRVQIPGATVEVFIDHTSAATVTADAQGRWLYPLPVSLADGTYHIQAQASYGSQTSPLSPPVKVIVDSLMVWSPLSMRFVSEYGHVVIPKDTDGRMDGDGWFVFLRPGVTYTVTLYVCCDDPNASVTLDLPGVSVTLTDPDDDGWYQATFTMPAGTAIPPGSTVTLCIVCYNSEYCSEGEVLIDPEGVVFDVTQGQDTLLQDAVVACYEGQTDLDSGETTYGLWDAASYGGQVNPQTTASDGYFSFFTPAGVFQLDVYKASFQPYRSWDLVVVDEPVEFNVPLTPDVAEEADWTITVSEAGFDQPMLTVQPGDVIQWINVGDEIHTSTSITPSARVEELGLLAPTYTDGWDSGLLNSGESYKRQLNTAGSYYYHDHENTAYTGLIVVQAEQYIYLPLVIKSP